MGQPSQTSRNRSAMRSAGAVGGRVRESATMPPDDDVTAAGRSLAVLGASVGRLARLVGELTPTTGRLDPDHTPPGVASAHLDELRRTFPGF